MIYKIKNHDMKIIHKLKIKWLRCFQQKMCLSCWEMKFLKSIKNKTRLTFKQLSKINEIYDYHRHGILPYNPHISPTEYGYTF